MENSPVLPDDAKAIIALPTATLCGNFKNAILRLPTLFYEFLNWMLTATGKLTNAFKQQVIPPGMIMPCAHATVPDDWLLCNGQEVSRVDYADLFSAIGVLYGVGNGSTTFNVPDYRARFIVGVGTFAGGGTAVLGTAGGEDRHSLTIAEAALDHIHVNGRWGAASGQQGDDLRLVTTDVDMDKGGLDGQQITSGNGFSEGPLSGYSGPYAVTTEALKTDNDPPVPTPHNNLPPYLPVNYLIKT